MLNCTDATASLKGLRRILNVEAEKCVILGASYDELKRVVEVCNVY